MSRQPDFLIYVTPEKLTEIETDPMTAHVGVDATGHRFAIAVEHGVVIRFVAVTEQEAREAAAKPLGSISEHGRLVYRSPSGTLADGEVFTGN